MVIPFHTKHCREFWGCHSSCPVMGLVKDRDRLKIVADELTLKYPEVLKDNVRAWQKVAELEARLRDVESETSRLGKELARTYE